VRFQTDFYGLPKTFSLYKKNYLDSIKELTGQPDSGFTFFSEATTKENLSVSGYKSVAVSMGSYGEVNLEQGLDVRIGGEIRPGTQLEAHLSDQGSTLDGATREISDFDMIYVTLKDPLYSLTAGDQYIDWPFQGILSGQKKIKGISATVAPSRFKFSAFGALSGGNFIIENFNGRNGIQGPYYLKGKGEAGFIMPIGGTVKIDVNGKSLQEGEDKDFTVDYDLGTFTFTPRVLIMDNDYIRVSYEYKMFDYQRLFTGSTAQYATKDSSLSVQGVIWSEMDNKNHPIDLILSPSDKQALINAGDKPPYGLTARPVNPNDVPVDDAVYALYKYKKDPSSGITFFKHIRYDPLHPDSVNGFFYVWFTETGENKGDYVATDSAIQSERVYEYVGPGKGNYSPAAPLPAPKRSTDGEMKADLNLPYLKSTLDVAGQENDKNLFSSLDDNDNLASSIRFNLLAGKKDYTRRSLWSGGNFNFASRGFDGEEISMFDRKDKWDDTLNSTWESESRTWESFIGTTVFPGMSTEFSYSQNLRDSLLVNDRFSNSTRVSLLKHFTLDYAGSLVRHHVFPVSGYTRKEDVGLLFDYNNHAIKLLYNDEWRLDSIECGRGHWGAGAEYDFIPWQVKQTINITQSKSGNSGLIASADTGLNFLYQGSINKKMFPWWTVNGSGQYLFSNIKNSETSTTLLMDFLSEMAPEKCGLSSSQHYRTSSEKASVFVQVPIFAGKGLGTYIYDSINDRYMLHTPGDYFVQQREVTNQDGTGRVKKSSLDLSWSYHPEKKIEGLLNDLSWQGNLMLEEHISSKVNSASSWMPGWHSLKAFFSDTTDNQVSYADLYYRQTIDWKPDSLLKGISGQLYLLPSYKRIQTYTEPGIDLGLQFELDKEKYYAGMNAHTFSIIHEDSVLTNYKISDLNTELTEKYRFKNDFDVYLKECIGWAGQRDIKSNRTIFSDSSFYYQISPGVTWRPGTAGWAEASYTFSSVNIPENLDFRLARGFSPGLSHVITINVNLQFGNHLMLNGSYRGELRKLKNESSFDKGDHTVSMEIKAFL
jgi:hypothetical protein